MKWFRRTLKRNRVFVLSLVLTELFFLADGRQFVYAYQVHQEKEQRLEEISELLDIPVGKLRPDHESLFESIRKVLGVEPEDPVKAAGLKRLQEVLGKHEDQLAANPYLPQIEAVKNEHQIYRVEGMIQDLMQLTQPKSGKALPEGSQKAILRNLHHGLKERVELPPLPEGLPAKAQARHAEMQAKLDRLFDSVRPIVAETQDAEKVQGTLAQKVEQLRLHQGVETRRATRAPRFVDRPLPLRRVEKKARTVEVSALDLKKAARRLPVSFSTPVEKISKAGIPAEIVELAESLGNSPAKIFTWVHDSVDFDPKWGAFKGPLGTLWEKSGTSWDQAWLLHDLLLAAGVDARFEWGEIEITTQQLTNITGLDDPWRAGDLLTTAGVPIVLLTQGSQVIAARMSHVWIKAHIDYIPNRGVTPGPGDTWVRMGPSLKQHEYAAGIQIHDDVPFSLGDYLLSGTELSPRRAYEEALWAHIRANDLVCTTLEQLKPAGHIIKEAFPFVPGTLRAKVTRLDGEATDLPAGFEQRIQLEVRTAGGTSLLTWQSELPALTGRRLELAWQGATADDQSTLDSYGGVFETPPYLVELKPVVKVGGLEQIAGTGIGSAEDVELYVTLTPTGGPVDVLVHQGHAGEPSVVVTDFGHASQHLVNQYQEAHVAAEGSGDASEAEVAALQLLGTTYLRNLGRDLEDLAGWNWHRLLRLVSEGMVAQTGDVTTTAGGEPLTFIRAERFVDMAGLTLGLFDTDGQGAHLKPTLELAGAQASYLEGEVFNEVVAREGIAAVSALTLARREGQSLTFVDGGNVDAVLTAVDLGEDVEAQVAAAVGQGKVAWVPESVVGANSWQGTGYVLADPATGAAAYLLSGGYAGGVDTGRLERAIRDILGREPWLASTLLGELFHLILAILGRGGGADTSGGPATYQSDPINMSTGNLWFTETDVTMRARLLPIRWMRAYNSRSDFSGPLGYGWTFNYGQQLEEHADGSVLYRDADGTEHTFMPDGTGGYTGPPGKHLSLQRGGAELTLRAKDGFASIFAEDGRLLRLSEPNGNTVTLGYDPAGQLTSITDAAGRTALTVTTSGDKITQLTDLFGRSVSYSYSGDDLSTVIDTLGNTWTYTYDSDHNLIAKTDALGNADSYSYDDLDRCIRHLDRLGYEEAFQYQSRGSRAVLTDRRGFDTYFEFDQQGRALLQVDPLGNASRSTWDADNNRTSTTDPRGGLSTRTFDDRGNLLSENNPLRETTTFTYDTEYDQLLTTTYAGGHTVTNTYDIHGNLRQTSQVVSGETITQSYSYDAFGQLETLTDANGHTTNLRWDTTKGTVESYTDTLGHITELTTDDLGRVVTITDPGGNAMTTGWDHGDRIVASNAYGIITTITYDAIGRQTEITTPRGTTVTEYDAVGRSVATTNPLGDTTRAEYDPAGNLTASIDSKGNRKTISHDAVGRPTATMDALGNVWSYGYCAEIGAGGGDCSTCSGDGAAGPGFGVGSFCELTDPLGNITSQSYDELGRLERITDPLGHQTVVTYDAQGRRQSVTDSLGRATSFEYDTLNRLTAVVEANGARTEYSHDKLGNLQNIKNAKGTNWPRTHDDLSRLASQTDPLGNTTQYFHDSLRNMDRKVRPDGREITYQYDEQRLTAVNLPGGALESFGYDSLGRRNSMENSEVSMSYVFDELNRRTQVSNNTLNQTIRYEYDANGNLTRLLGPQGPVEYFYDSMDRLVEQRDSMTGLYRYEYDQLGRRSSLSYPNGMKTSYTYDDASRLESIVTRNGQGEVVDGYGYTYDPVGNRVSMTALHQGVTHTYEYDEVYRLTRWERGSDRFEAYTYDDVGNRETATNELGVTTYGYDLANQLLTESRQLNDGTTSATAYVWDSAGNLTSKTVDSTTTNYQWDVLDRLVELTGPSGTHSYGYDPAGIRSRQTDNGETKLFLHAREDILGVFDDRGGLETYYVHGPGFDEPVAQVAAGSPSYLHRDALGSVTALTSSPGQVAGRKGYAAFGGVETVNGIESRYGYTSREAGADGYMYYRSRFLDTGSGRFLSRDLYRGNVLLPASLHSYSYVHNNPIRSTDPYGTFSLIHTLVFLMVVIALFLVGRHILEGMKAVDWGEMDEQTPEGTRRKLKKLKDAMDDPGPCGRKYRAAMFRLPGVASHGVLRKAMHGLQWLYFNCKGKPLERQGTYAAVAEIQEVIELDPKVEFRRAD